MSVCSSRKQRPSIVLLCGRLWELILVRDQLLLRPPFSISEVVAFESFDCNLVIDDKFHNH